VAVDSLQAIRIFTRVVETGSFTRAADSLDMPLASASRLVHDLEAQLGVKLLRRTTRTVSVTADGAAYYERTVHLVRELDEVNSSFGTGHARPQGRIKVDTSASLASSFLIPALPRFHARHPDIEIELCVGDRLVHMISENVDCAIRGGPMLDETVVARGIGQAAWTTCATPGYLAHHGTPATPQDLLVGHVMVNFIATRTGKVVPASFGDGNRSMQVATSSFLSVNEGNAHLAAGLAGVGIIHSFDFKVRPHIEAGKLVAILESWRPPPYPYHVVYPQNRHLSQRLRVFIDWLVEIGAELG
jgi:LysR family transcriptional regulator for bpeEF and oprC